MARVPGAGTSLWIDNYSMKPLANQADINIDNDLVDVSAFGDTWTEWLEEVYNSTAEINGFFDGTDDTLDDFVHALIGDGTEHHLGVYPGQDASHGDFGYELAVLVAGKPHRSRVGAGQIIQCRFQGSEPVVRATVLCNGAVTGTGAITNSNKNLGALSAGEEFVAIVRVISVSGSGSITVDIEQSSDDGGGDAYALISGMQTTMTAVGSTRLTTVAATEAYKRVNVTAFSGFSSVTLLVTAGQAQGVPAT